MEWLVSVLQCSSPSLYNLKEILNICIKNYPFEWTYYKIKLSLQINNGTDTFKRVKKDNL